MFEETQYTILKDRLRIDQLRLDEELIQHPMLTQEVTELAAGALRIRDAAKRDAEQNEAKVARQIRAEMKDGKAPSETQIKASLSLYKSVQAMAQALDDAGHDLRLWQGMVDAYIQRGSSLKRVAELIIAGYLAPQMVHRKEVQNKRDEWQANRADDKPTKHRPPE